MSKFKNYFYANVRYDLFEELDRSQKMTVNKWHHPESPYIKNKSGRETIPIESESKVKTHLKRHGYEIKDYASGIATRKTIVNHPTLGPTEKHVDEKIGGVLDKTNAPDEVKREFQNDDRTSQIDRNDLRATISAHPHDVAGQSTNRSWSSCTHMKGCKNPESDGSKGGLFSHKLQGMVESGQHVAYLHHKDDTKLENPRSRIALHVYHELDENGKKTDRKILKPSPRTYGEQHTGFRKTVSDWCNKNSPQDKTKDYAIDDSAYADGAPSELINEKTVKDVEDSSKPGLSKERLDELSTSKNASIRFNLARHQKLLSHHIDNIMGDAHIPSPLLGSIMAKQEHLQDRHIHRLLRSGYAPTHNILNDRLTNKQKSDALNLNDPDINFNLAKNHKLSDAHISHLVKDRDPNIIHALTTNQHIKLARVVKATS